MKVLTAQARVRAAAVAVETAALVDAVAALESLEARLGVTWRQWVAWQCGLTTAEARRVCLLAAKLPTLPLVDAAFRRGELSDGITEKIARVATPANEAVVLQAAEAATAAQLEQVVRDFRTVRSGSTPPPGAALDDPATMPSEASWGWDDHGRFRGRWNLRADDGAVFEAALELALSRFRRTEADIDDRSDGTDPSDPDPVPDVRRADGQPPGRRADDEQPTSAAHATNPSRTTPATPSPPPGTWPMPRRRAPPPRARPTSTTTPTTTTDPTRARHDRHPTANDAPPVPRPP